MSFKPGPTKRERPTRYLDVTYEGREYRIPEMWLAGFCQRTGYTVQQALRWWHEQELADEAGSAALYLVGIAFLVVLPAVFLAGKALGSVSYWMC